VNSLDYHWVFRFLSALLYSIVSSPNDFLGKGLLLQSSLSEGVLLLYNALRWRLSRGGSILLLLLFCSLPEVLTASCYMTADMPLTIVYAAALFYSIKYMTDSNIQDLSLALIFSFFLIFIKNEGVPLSVINIILICVYTVSRKPILNKKVNLRSGAVFVVALSIFFMEFFSTSVTRKLSCKVNAFLFYCYP